MASSATRWGLRRIKVKPTRVGAHLSAFRMLLGPEQVARTVHHFLAVAMVQRCDSETSASRFARDV
jgi:hypothetical protein